ncbi:hypothetical protein [Microvirga massiliensis]|uniref:hypothetical protein n=1 Tax=Microvirga massiliensis TaxID=1033741 RepID=UPI00065FB457|nr:hypothetical protein [Microvirga massiliensis]
MEQISSNSTIGYQPVGIDCEGHALPSFVDALIDPGHVFAHPFEVVEHPWFGSEEKRTILLSWARDELVAEQVASRVAPELQVRSRIDAVIDALSHFDAAAAGEYLSATKTIRAGHAGRARQRSCQ